MRAHTTKTLLPALPEPNFGVVKKCGTNWHIIEPAEGIVCAKLIHLLYLSESDQGKVSIDRVSWSPLCCMLYNIECENIPETFDEFICYTVYPGVLPETMVLHVVLFDIMKAWYSMYYLK